MPSFLLNLTFLVRISNFWDKIQFYLFYHFRLIHRYQQPYKQTLKFRMYRLLLCVMLPGTCLRSHGIPYAPYLARQFSKPHRSHNFEARKLKFGTNVVPWSMHKCINFQLIISDTSGTIYFLVMVPKKSCAHQYNEKFKNFATFVHLNCCVAFECGFAGA